MVSLKLLKFDQINWLNELERNERERLDIPSLKVRFNRQFGWFIERELTIENCLRFSLKILESSFIDGSSVKSLTRNLTVV